MRLEEPEERPVEAGDVPARWDELLSAAERGELRSVIARDGKPVTALISMRDLWRFHNLLEDRRRAFEPIEQTRAALAHIPDDELEREIDRAAAEARARLRAERRAMREERTVTP